MKKFDYVEFACGIFMSIFIFGWFYLFVALFH